MVHVPELWAAGRFHPAAKNVAAAAKFGEEAYRIADWMKNTQPFKSLSEGRWNRIMAGAHRFNARYLLEGGDAAGSFKSYWRGLIAYPPAVLPELHRMIYALLSMVGLGRSETAVFFPAPISSPGKDGLESDMMQQNYSTTTGLFTQNITLRRITILLLLLLGLGIRLLDLTDPPLDIHPTRQLHSALMARGMYYQGRTDVPEWQVTTAVSSGNVKQ